MKVGYTNDIESLVTHNLDKIDPDSTVEVNLADLVYVYQTLNEYMRFFHQPDHYPHIQSVERFLGSIKDPGGFSALNTALYRKMAPMIPDNIARMFDDSVFDSEQYPWYYLPEEHQKQQG